MLDFKIDPKEGIFRSRAARFKGLGVYIKNYSCGGTPYGTPFRHCIRDVDLNVRDHKHHT